MGKAKTTEVAAIASRGCRKAAKNRAVEAEATQQKKSVNMIPPRPFVAIPDCCPSHAAVPPTSRQNIAEMMAQPHNIPLMYCQR
jgi:hypothetical protein